MDYQNDEYLTWMVNSGCGEVRIVSSIFDLESGYDFLTIDGVRHTGNDGINQVVNRNEFTIKFQSDGSETHRGFILNWNCMPG